MNDLNSSRWAPASTNHPSQSRSPVRRPPGGGLTGGFSPNTQIQNNTPILSSSFAQPYHQQPQPATQSLLTSSQRKLQTRLQEYNRFVKLLRRLKWKSYSLLSGHERTLAIHAREDMDHSSLAGDGVGHFINTSRDAETMFKIDFFEYYVLLERTLVCLLGSFDVVISSTADQNRFVAMSGQTSSNNKDSILGDSRTFHGTRYHRFHANVLAALDQSENPLHQLFGQGDIRSYLGIAKEFRNRWKDAELGTFEHGVDGVAQEEITYGMRKRYEKILRDLRLEEMVFCFVERLEAGRTLAEHEIAAKAREAGVVVQRASEGGAGEIVASVAAFENGQMGHGMGPVKLDLHGHGDQEELPWEAMPDAMEWD